MYSLSVPELSHASASTVIIACVLAGAIAFIVGLAATALIRRLAARRNLDLRRQPRDYIGEDTEPPTGNPKTSPQP